MGKLLHCVKLFFVLFLFIQVQKAELNDVEIEYGPIYWTYNRTLYPTTTTTTTTTT